MRIARALAAAGVAARRKCEAIILRGEVSVNGERVQDLGRQVDPVKDRILFRGRPVRAQERVFFLLHKPAGYTTTAADPHAAKTVYELLPAELRSGRTRVFPVGRLDRDSTGLLLFTNDGELANRLTHPRYEVGKWYEVRLDRPLKPEDRGRLLKGVPLEEGAARAEEVEVPAAGKVRLLLREGKKREVRRLFDRLGYRVLALCRTDFGPLTLAGLKPGQGRFLTAEEAGGLRRATAPRGLISRR